MCISCLQNQLTSIEEYDRENSEYLAGIKCECCKSFPSFLLSVNNDLKLLCLTKMKRHRVVCVSGGEKLMRLEELVKQKIKNRLESVLEQIDDVKEELNDHLYLNRMDQIKSLNDMVGELDDADHR
jgi:PHD/YefM family antitoxin component YafN of YafNO toxin-antitoxin module